MNFCVKIGTLYRIFCFIFALEKELKRKLFEEIYLRS